MSNNKDETITIDSLFDGFGLDSKKVEEIPITESTFARFDLSGLSNDFRQRKIAGNARLRKIVAKTIVYNLKNCPDKVKDAHIGLLLTGGFINKTRFEKLHNYLKEQKGMGYIHSLQNKQYFTRLIERGLIHLPTKMVQNEMFNGKPLKKPLKSFCVKNFDLEHLNLHLENNSFRKNFLFGKNPELAIDFLLAKIENKEWQEFVHRGYFNQLIGRCKNILIVHYLYQDNPQMYEKLFKLYSKAGNKKSKTSEKRIVSLCERIIEDVDHEVAHDSLAHSIVLINKI